MIKDNFKIKLLCLDSPIEKHYDIQFSYYHNDRVILFSYNILDYEKENITIIIMNVDFNRDKIENVKS